MGDCDKHTSMAMANRKGVVSFPSPVAVHVGLEAVEHPESSGEYSLKNPTRN